MTNNFNFIIPLKKSTGDTLTGIASTTSVDRDGERMSSDALKMMVDDIKRVGVNLFGNHEHSWENILGGIDDASLVGDQVHIKINPNKSNPKYPQLMGTLSTKGVRVGLSVGGNVESTKEEYDKEQRKKVKVLDEVSVYEVSVVGIPSNADSFMSIPNAIAKSIREKSKACPKHPDYDMYICQVCERDLCPKCDGGEPVWRPDITGYEGAGNVCPRCLARHQKSCPICFTQMNKECQICLYTEA